MLKEKKGMSEYEMVGWHHPLNGHGFGRTPGVGDGQGDLAIHGSQRVGHDWATELNWRNAEEKNVCPFLLLENSRPLVSTSRAPYPFLLLGDPELLINLPMNWLSQLVLTKLYLQIFGLQATIAQPFSKAFLLFTQNDSYYVLSLENWEVIPIIFIGLNSFIEHWERLLHFLNS